MKKIMGILVCFLFISMAFSAAAQTIKNNEKDENQDTVFLENSPPTDPIITCPDRVRKNWMFLLRAVSTDPDGDQIYYRLKVGEENKPSYWIGPRESGQEYASGVGIFRFTGDIKIGVQSKDVYGAESDWSYHTITYTKSKSINSPLIQILQNYPILYQLFLKFFII